MTEIKRQRRKYPWKTLISILLIFIVLAYFKYYFNQVPEALKVQSVEVQIGGIGQEENQHFTLEMPTNIEEILSIHKQLILYKDPKVTTWPLDVSMTYHLRNGKTQTTTFKDIRPVSDYFKVIYNSVEYKRQMNPIFTLDAKGVTKVVLTGNSVSRGKKIETENKSIIKSLIEQARFAAENRNLEMEYYLIGTIDFMEGEKRIGQSMILREQDIWQETLMQERQLMGIYENVEEIKEILITNDETNQVVSITDPVLKQSVLNTYYNWHSSESSEYSVEIVLMDSSRDHIFGSFYKGQVPAEIEALF